MGPVLRASTVVAGLILVAALVPSEAVAADALTVSGYQVTECVFLDALPDLFAPARVYTPIRRWLPNPARGV